ncbi:MAG: phosphoribosylglycinamide formyltransferase [Phycisphaerae bacterium]
MTEQSSRNDGPIRLGVLLSGGGRTLANLLDLAEAGQFDAEIATVIASRPCRGLEVASNAHIPAQVVEYRKAESQQAYSDQISAILDSAEVDLVILAGFLSLWFLPERYVGRVMNIHPALLPMFGGKGMYGRRVHEAVLAAGCKISGCTVHYVNNEYDAGPIVAQVAVPVREGDTAESLAARVFEAECELYPHAIDLHAQGKLRIEGDIVHVDG